MQASPRPAFTDRVAQYESSELQYSFFLLRSNDRKNVTLHKFILLTKSYRQNQVNEFSVLVDFQRKIVSIISQRAK